MQFKHEQLEFKGLRDYTTPWKVIWKMQDTKRQHLFGWLLLHDRVLTKMLLVKRGKVTDAFCPSCSNEEESPLHLFRDCKSAKALWLQVILAYMLNYFLFSLHWETWVICNLMKKEFSWENLSWHSFFVIICWWLWKKRNELVFREVNSPLSVIFLKRQV